MIHAMALSVVIAYEKYLEFSEGWFYSSWENDSPADLCKYMDVLSSHMLNYQLILRKYPGDVEMR